MVNAKPRVIRELEQIYWIKLKQKDKVTWSDRYSYELDSNGEVITLNLNNKGITKIEHLDKFTNLTSLYLDNNQISKIENLDNLIKLTSLHLNHNQITKIENLGNLINLTNLYLNRNQITKIENLNNLINLIKLYLNDNHITKIENLGTLCSLIELSLHSNQIIKIENLDNLTNLTEIDFSVNQITKIENLEKLSTLTSLNLNANQISKIENLDNLTNLNLNNNQITKIENLDNLIKLTSLHLYSNLISNFDEIKNFINTLEEIQRSKERKLNYFAISPNPFEEKFIELKIKNYTNNLEDIKNCIKLTMAKDATKEIPLIQKVMLIGNHASGKSTFLHYFLNGAISQQFQESTHILSIENYPNDSKEPQAVFYDFGGQDYYHGLYKAFMTNNSLNLIFWKQSTDNNTLSFDDSLRTQNTQNFNRGYWIKQLQYYGHTTKSYLLQTHLENQNDIVKLDNGELSSRILKEFHMDILNESDEDIGFLTTSLLNRIAKRDKIVISQSYIDFLNNIIVGHKSSEVSKIIELEKEFNNVANIDFKWVLEQLSLQGLILYYPNIEKLKDVAWLNPQAIVKKIHNEILSTISIKQYKGNVPKAYFEKICEENIRLMLIENKVIFLDKNTQTYIIPSFLPREDILEKFLLPNDEKLRFVLKFRYFIPFGFINQLICLYGEMEKDKKYWRDMLMFTLQDDNNVYIKLNFKKLEIWIYTVNKNDKVERAILEDIFALYFDRDRYYKSKINTQNEDCQIEREVPQDIYLSIENEFFVDYNQLETTQEQTIPLFVRDNNNILQLKAHIGGRNEPVSKYKIFTDNPIAHKKKKVFISYSKDDDGVKIIERLQKELEGKDLLVYVDILTVESGNNEVEKRIRQELEDADVIIFMISTNFLKNDWIINNEVIVTMNMKEKDKKDILIQTIIMEEFTDMNELSKRYLSPSNDIERAKNWLGRTYYLPFFEENNNKTVSMKQAELNEKLINACMQITKSISTALRS